MAELLGRESDLDDGPENAEGPTVKHCGLDQCMPMMWSERVQKGPTTDTIGRAAGRRC